MDPSKLLKTLSSAKGQILAGHIAMYLEAGKFPAGGRDLWMQTVKEEDGNFHPSSHCFTPPRELYYTLAEARGLVPVESKRRPISASLQLTFDCGTLWHMYLGEVLQELGFVEPENVERKLDFKRAVGTGVSFMVSGTADLVDVAIPGHGEWLVDMKTMNGLDFKRGANDDLLAKWQAQVGIYMDGLDTEKAFVLAIEKDRPHGLREYVIERDDDLISDIYERWAYVEECLQLGEAPPCDHGYGESCGLGHRCSYET